MRQIDKTLINNLNSTIHFRNKLDEMALIRTDSNGIIRDVNTNIQLLFGYKNNYFKNKSIFTFIDNEQFKSIELKDLVKNIRKPKNLSYSIDAKSKVIAKTTIIPQISNKNEEYIFVLKAVLENKKHKPNVNELFQKHNLNIQQIIESIPQIVWTANLSGDINYFSKRWYDYTHLNYNLTDKNDWMEFIHEQDRDMIKTLWNRLIQNGRAFDFEVRLKDESSHDYKWFLCKGNPIPNKNGFVGQWFGTFTDINNSKQFFQSQIFLSKVGKELSSSLDYQKTIVKVADLAIPDICDWCSIEIIEDGVLKQIALSHINSLKLKQAQKISTLYPPQLEDDFGISQALRTGKSELLSLVSHEHIVKMARNTQHYNLIKEVGFSSAIFVPIKIDNSSIGALQLVSTDSNRRFNDSDLQLAEEFAIRISNSIHNSKLYKQVQHYNNQLMSLFNSNIIGVFYTNKLGEISNANDAFFEMLGYESSDIDLKKISLSDITTSKFKHNDDLAISNLNNNGIAKPYEKEFIKKDGNIISVIVGSVTTDKHRKEITSFVLDITERKKLEQRKDEFIGIASHELKTPLTSVKGYVQILERIITQMGDDKLKGYVKKTNNYINKLNSLIADLLDVSKVQAGKLQLNYSNANINEILKESIESIQNTQTYHNIIKSNISSKIMIDSHRVEQVITNLLSNAIKYSPKSETVIVKAKEFKDKIMIYIQDFGLGISQIDSEKIFERFYRSETTSQMISGLGIVPYISWEIVQRHGGKMWVNSQIGQGSKFYFTLPKY